MEIIDSRENLIRLINQYQNLVFSVCLKTTGDYFTAEDITQETFIAAYKHWDSFDGTNEKAWLCRIASNKSIDFMKLAARNTISIDDETAMELPDDNELTEEIINREVMDEFESAIESLEEPYKSVARGHFIEGKTAKEISTATGAKLKTIQTHIFRAKSQLKNIIRKEDLIT